MNTDDAVSATTPFIDDDARDTVTVSGADAATYLQSQIAQEIRDLAVGSSRWTFVLDPSGKVDVLARIARTGDDEFTLDTDAGFGAALLERLDRFKIRVAAETNLQQAVSEVPARDREAARIAGGWPRMGAEIVPGDTIPANTGVLSLAVNFTKGCYPGQELVERMDSRGADAPRALRMIDLESGAEVGEKLVDDDGAEVGVITSVHPDGGIGLGYVKRGTDVGSPPPHMS